MLHAPTVYLNICSWSYKFEIKWVIFQKKIWLEKEKKIQLSVTSIGIAVLPKYTNITPLIVSKKKKKVLKMVYLTYYILILTSYLVDQL